MANEGCRFDWAHDEEFPEKFAIKLQLMPETLTGPILTL